MFCIIDLLITAPGLQAGVDFRAVRKTAENAPSIIKLADIFAEADDMLDFETVEDDEPQPAEQEVHNLEKVIVAYLFNNK